MSSIYWPGTEIIKSQNNAFTAHMRPRDPEEPTRGCKKCGEQKPLSAFPIHTYTCGKCRHQQAKQRKATKAAHGGAYSRAGTP